MKKYNCEIYKIKERKVKDKYRYDIVGYRIYPNITKEAALYLAVKYGGGIAGFDENKPCHPEKSDKVVGFYKWGNDIDLALVNPVYSSDEYLEGLFFSPRIQSYGLPKRDKWFDKKIENLINLYRGDTTFDDFGIEAYYVWGPNSLIPKGYEHIKEGIVSDGDYVFKWESNPINPDYWLSVDASFSGIRKGTEIQYKGILRYKGDQGFRKDGDVTYGYEPFIIRKSCVGQNYNPFGREVQP